MLDVELYKPDIRFKDSFLDALDEFEIEQEKKDWIYLGTQEPIDTPTQNFGLYLKRLLATEHTAQPHFVTTTTYWAVYNHHPHANKKRFWIELDYSRQNNK